MKKALVVLLALCMLLTAAGVSYRQYEPSGREISFTV